MEKGRDMEMLDDTSRNTQASPSVLASGRAIFSSLQTSAMPSELPCAVPSLLRRALRSTWAAREAFSLLRNSSSSTSSSSSSSSSRRAGFLSASLSSGCARAKPVDSARGWKPGVDGLRRQKGGAKERLGPGWRER